MNFTGDTAMSAGTNCLRCGGTRMISAQSEQPTGFCLDHHGHHGVLRVCLKAALCRDCGHVEFWAPDPGKLSEGRDASDTHTLQEEDF